MLTVNGFGLVDWIAGAREAITVWADRLLGEVTATPGAIAAAANPENAIAAGRIALLIALVLITQRLIRDRGRALIAGLAAWQERAGQGLGPLRHLVVIALVIVLQGAKVAVVAAIGYAAIVLGISASAEASAIAGRFVLAFVIAESLRLAINAFLEPRASAARLLPVSDAGAARWEAQLSHLIRVAIYGLLWVTPTLSTIAPALAVLVEAAIAVIVLMGVGRLIRAARRPVQQWMLGRAAHHPGSFYGPVLRPLAGVWHGLAGGFATLYAVLIVTGPASALVFVSQASGLSLLIILAAGFIGTSLANLRRIGRYLPQRLRDRLPMLAGRIDAWVPRFVGVIHWLLIAALIGSLLDVWGLADVAQWLSTPAGQALIHSVVALLVIGILAVGGWLVAASWIEDRLNPDTGTGEPGAREKTLLALFRNAVAIAILILAGMVALSEIGIDIGPLLAGAGVIGLAIGFGAQKLVQDIITGVFIQLEDAIHQDDFVTAAGISGTVERLSIRSLGLRDLSGVLHVVPFSSVDTVSNYTRDFGYHLGEYRLAYRESVADAIDALHSAYAQLQATPEIGSEVTGALEVDGVSALADSAVVIRVRIRTTAGMQYAVGRAYNRCVKERFDAAGIEIPYPHRTLYFGAGDEADGSEALKA